MTRHRTIASTIALTGFLLGVTCATASAGTLLSGYGSPGEGEQAILGSQMLNSSTNGRDSGHSLSAVTQTRVAEGQIGQVEQENSASVRRTEPQSGARSTPAPSLGGAKENDAHPPASIEAPAHGVTDQSHMPSAVTVAQASYDSRLGLSAGQTLMVALVAGGLLALALLTKHLSKLQR
jgi:hypothetical protein